MHIELLIARLSQAEHILMDGNAPPYAEQNVALKQGDIALLIAALGLVQAVRNVNSK